MAIGGMMGGMLGNLDNLKHDNWAGAIWGGTKAAAGNIASDVQAAVTGERTFTDWQGHERSIPVDRMATLGNVGTRVGCAYRAHTFSVRDPKGFQQMQQSIARFQGH